MNRLAKWMMRLYPARWRRRYGDELDALLSETGADARIVADLMKGSIRMQFSTWSFAKLAVVLGVTGLLLGTAGSFLVTPMYVSRAMLGLTSLSAESASTELDSEIQRVKPLMLSRSSLAKIMNEPQLSLYTSELKVRTLEDVADEMRNAISLDAFVPSNPRANSALVQISFQYPDAAKAQLITAKLVQNFVNESFDARFNPGRGKPYPKVIDPPSLPVSPIFPRRGTGEIIGCLLFASIPIAWRRLRGKKVATWGAAISMVAFALIGTIAADIVFDPLADSGQNLFGLRYRSTATMFVQNGSPEQLQTVASDVSSRTALTTVVTDPRLDLYKEQRKTQPLDDVIQNMRGNLVIAPSGKYINISFDYPDRYKTQQTVALLMNRFEDAYVQNYGGLPDAPVQSAPTTLKLLDPASLPLLPVSPNRYLIAMQGGLAGLIAAAIIAAIRRRWNPKAELPVDAVNG